MQTLQDVMAGSFKVYADRGEGDSIVEDSTVIQLVDKDENGEVEVGWTSGSERFYLRFKLTDLTAIVLKN